MRSTVAWGIVIIFCLWLAPANASDLAATWTGRGDASSYSDAQNWDIQVVPCNVGTVSFKVFIPEGYTVSADVPECQVSSLEVGDDSNFNIESNCNLNVLGTPQIYGLLKADNSTFLGSPFHLLGNKARVYGVRGANISVGSGDPSMENIYSSLGLWVISGYGGSTRYWDLFLADGDNTLLDLSSVKSIDAGFNDNDNNDHNIQRIQALNGSTIDLSGLININSPQSLKDKLQFTINQNSKILLTSLSEVVNEGKGITEFSAIDNSTLYLPSLTNASHIFFNALGGSTISVDDPNDSKTPDQLMYSSAGIWAISGYGGSTRYWDLFLADGDNTLLNLSSVKSIDAGFNDNDSNDYNIQRIQALDGGTIDLSGLEKVIAPVRNEDRIEFIVNEGTLIFGTISEDGPPFINIAGAQSDPSTALLEVKGDMHLQEPNELHFSEATLKVGGDLIYTLTNEADFKAADILNEDTVNSIVHFNGNGTQMLEAGGLDVDTYTVLLQNDNFGFGKMIVGQPDQPTTVSLQDDHFNGNGCKSEALYLFGVSDTDPNGLLIHEGSSLVLNGINVYALRNGVMEHLNSLLGNAEEIAYQGGGTIRRGNPVCEGDFDLDGDVDGSDLATFAAGFGRTDCSQENPCNGDFCFDGDVDGTDLSVFSNDFGRTGCPDMQSESSNSNQP